MSSQVGETQGQLGDFWDLNKQNSGLSTKISTLSPGEMLCGYPLSTLDKKR